MKTELPYVATKVMQLKTRIQDNFCTKILAHFEFIISSVHNKTQESDRENQDLYIGMGYGFNCC